MLLLKYSGYQTGLRLNLLINNWGWQPEMQYLEANNEVYCLVDAKTTDFVHEGDLTYVPPDFAFVGPDKPASIQSKISTEV